MPSVHISMFLPPTTLLAATLIQIIVAVIIIFPIKVNVFLIFIFLLL